MQQRTIRIAVVSSIESPTLRNKIRPVAEQRGHVLDVLPVSVVEQSDLLRTEFVQSLRAYDVVYYRTGLGQAGALLLEQYLRSVDVPCVNLFYGQYPYFQHKLFQTAVVAMAGIRTPKTLAGYGVSYDALVTQLDIPFIAKANEGTHGDLVYRLESAKDFVAMNKEVLANDMLYQEYIPHTFDYRVPVVDGSALYPYARVPASGEFRANVTRGGTTTKVDTDQEKDVCAFAERVARVCGIDIMGVDILAHKETGELYFAETNDNPGWKHVDQVCGGDPSSAVVDLLEKRAVEGNPE